MVEYSYTLGAAGERLKVVETDRTVEYEYDELYRLVKETVTDSNGTIVTEYTYDRNSNRLTKTVDGNVTEYAYNELNQLVSETGITYEYDLNGNLVKKTDVEQTTTYTYNAQNRLIRVTVQSGQQVNVEEYRYDYAGNRIAKIGELSTTYYLVDTNGALSQVLAEYDENGSLTTYYTRGEELISQERGNEKHYYLYDGFDSVRMLTDVTGFKYYNGSEVKKLYLSAILDLYDRRIVAYKISEHNNNELVFSKFDEAVALNPNAHPLFHSDRGFQYTTKAFHQKLMDAGMRQSMSRVGRCIDNGSMEGYWGIISKNFLPKKI